MNSPHRLGLKIPRAALGMPVAVRPTSARQRPEPLPRGRRLA
jgi:hypothetical protein